MKKWPYEKKLSHLAEGNPPTLKWLEHFNNFHITQGKSPFSQLILKCNLFPGILPIVLTLPVLSVRCILCVGLSLRMDIKRESFCSCLGSGSPGKVGQEAPMGAFFFYSEQAIESITMIYRDTLKVNYVVNACPLGQLRITGKKCKKFEIPNSKGWQENMVLFFYE